MNYITHPHSLMVRPEGEPIFSEMATTVRLDDESGGPYVVVEQTGHIERVGKISIDSKEWPPLREAIDNMIALCEQIKAEPIRSET